MSEFVRRHVLPIVDHASGWTVATAKWDTVPDYPIDAVRDGMDEATQRQELDLDWNATTSKRVYPGFKEEEHVSRQRLPFDPGRPLVIGLDTGGSAWTGTPAACAMQLNNHGQLLVFGSMSPPEEETVGVLEFAWEVYEWLTEEFAAPYGMSLEELQVVFYGDPAGKNPPAVGVAMSRGRERQSCYEILQGGERRPAGHDEFNEPVYDILPSPGWMIEDGEVSLVKRMEMVRSRLQSRTRDGYAALVVDPEARDIIKGFMGAYHYHQRQDGRYELDPMKNWFSHCLAGETLIETQRGQVPIREVTTYDQVLTRQGWRQVKASWCSGISPLFEIEFSNGKRLKATSQHLVWADNSWVAVRSLRYNQVCSERQLSTKARSTIGIPTPRTPATETTSSAGRGVAPSDFMSLFGKRLTGLLQRGCTFITRMVSSKITTFLIWSASPRSSMWRNIWMKSAVSEVANTCFESLRNLTPGTVPQRELSGIGRMGSILLDSRSKIQRPTPATTAVSLTSRQLRTEDSGSVVECASPLGGELPRKIMCSGSAVTAEHPSRLTNTVVPETAPLAVRAVRALKIHEPVYDLTVEGAPEFFANGVLVHNSMNSFEYGNSRMDWAMPNRDDLNQHEGYQEFAGTATSVGSRASRRR